MNESDKKIIKNINTDTLLLIDETFGLYKAFITKPTTKTLNNFIDAANRYKESFIEDAGKFKSTDANDLVYGPEFRLLVDSMDDSVKKNLFGLKPQKPNNKVYQRFNASISREMARRANKGLSIISDIQILNRAVLYFTEFVGTPFQNAKSIREEAELKINPSAVKRLQNEDQDGNTKGPLKLFVKKTNVPKQLIEDYEIKTDEAIDFTEFNIVKYQHWIHHTKETDINDSRAYYKAMPRRVYFEADKGTSRRFCWFEARKEFQYLTRYFIDHYSDNESLIDPRIDLDQEMHNSKDMESDKYQSYLRQFSLNDEEYEYFKNNNFKFLYFKARYKKSLRQILHGTSNRNGIADWIDVCLYNDDQITIRSFTNDLDYIPRVSGYDADFINDILVMSNELPRLSHQALSFFAFELDDEYRKSKNIDDRIYDTIATDSTLELEDISIMEGLESAYVLSIIKDNFNKKISNFDWPESKKQEVTHAVKKIIESEKLKKRTL